MKKQKRKAFQPFSIAFLDCICCGFGAIILLFVLTSGKKSEHRVNELSDTEIDLGQLSRSIKAEELALLRLTSSIEEIRKKIEELMVKEQDYSETLVDKTTNLTLLLTQLSELEELQATLIGEKEALPTVPEEVPIQVPNPVRRQYLTDFKLDGQRVLFLIEASGGMMADSAEATLPLLSIPDEEKRQSEKWTRVVRSVEWLLTALKPPSAYQIFYFNKETVPLIPTRLTEWLPINDRATTAEVISRLRDVTPEGGANLERAFYFIGGLDPRPDNIILFTDGLPTLSDSAPAGSIVDEASRMRMFNAAQRQMPLGVPINIIMFPWNGDPAAASSFWLLATKAKGSFICPSRTWPEI